MTTIFGGAARPPSGALRRRTRATILIALLVILTIPPTPAGAQEFSYRLDLVRAPVFHALDDRLDLRLRVVNEGDAPLPGFRLIVGAYDRVANRSTLHEQYDLSEVEPSSSFPVAFVDPSDNLEAGNSRVVTVTEQVAALQTVALDGSQGVYPLKITLQDAAGVPLDSVTTQLLLYSGSQQARLKIAVVVPLADRPSRGPDGIFDGDAGGVPLEDSLERGGWLRGITGTVARLQNTPGDGRPGLALALEPRLLQEIADMADGYRRDAGGGVAEVEPTAPEARSAATWLRRLREIMDRPGVQPMLTPYSFADLPSIDSSGPYSSIATQMTAGRAVFEEVLESKPAEGWAFAPAGRIDTDTIDLLEQAGVEHTFVSEDALEDLGERTLSGCPVAELSFACPVVLPTSLGSEITGYLMEPELQSRLDGLARGDGGSGVGVQRFFAETAMIREEIPNRSDRIVQVTLPAGLHPRPWLARQVLGGIARAPWLEAVTPGRGLTSHRADRRDVVGNIEPAGDQPAPEYFAGIAAAAGIVEDYRSVKPPDNIVRRLQENILVAQSKLWWGDPTEGSAFVTASRAEALSELNKIGIVSRDEITLTSSRGAVQLAIFNDTGYPVEVDVRLFSEQLEELPELDPVVLDSAQKPLQFDVRSESSGIFPLRVQLTTPNGTPIGEPSLITVRSTEFNEIALGITIGALAFLVLFYMVRWTRHRRATTEGSLEENLA